MMGYFEDSPGDRGDPPDARRCEEHGPGCGHCEECGGPIDDGQRQGCDECGEVCSRVCHTSRHMRWELGPVPIDWWWVGWAEFWRVRKLGPSHRAPVLDIPPGFWMVGWRCGCEDVVRERDGRRMRWERCGAHKGGVAT